MKNKTKAKEFQVKKLQDSIRKFGDTTGSKKARLRKLM
jgi:hypothetical protein